MNTKVILPCLPSSLCSVNIFRNGTIQKVTVSWTRYTSNLNAKRGRFGLKKRSKKLCNQTYELQVGI
jgi:hypothetical protein